MLYILPSYAFSRNFGWTIRRDGAPVDEVADMGQSLLHQRPEQWPSPKWPLNLTSKKRRETGPGYSIHARCEKELPNAGQIPTK
jgi:hypothetical protein